MSRVLAELAALAPAAVASALDALGPELAEQHEVRLAGPREDALTDVELPVVLGEAAAPDGGSVLLVVNVTAARRLAAASGAIDEDEAEAADPDPREPELAAVRDLTDRLAAAMSAGALPPAVTRVLRHTEQLSSALAYGAPAIVVPLTLLGESCRIIQTVAGHDAAALEARDDAASAPDLGPTPLGPALRSIDVRVWAELGRAQMPTGRLVGLPSGAIVELDRDAEDAVDLFVDGQRYATGRLVVTEDDSWAVRIERVLGGR